MTAPVTGITPIYGIEYPVEGEPIRYTRQKLQRNAQQIEAALQAGGVAAAGASDLLAVSGRVSTLEAITGTGAYATMIGTGTLAVPGTGTWTALPMTGAETDPLNGHSLTTNTPRWTCPVGQGGLYLAGGIVSFAGGSTTGRRLAGVSKNGAQLSQAQGSAAAATVSSSAVVSPWPYVMTAGDYLELYAWQDSGSNMNAQLQFSGFWCVRLVKF